MSDDNGQFGVWFAPERAPLEAWRFEPGEFTLKVEPDGRRGWAWAVRCAGAVIGFGSYEASKEGAKASALAVYKREGDAARAREPKVALAVEDRATERMALRVLIEQLGLRVPAGEVLVVDGRRAGAPPPLLPEFDPVILDARRERRRPGALRARAPRSRRRRRTAER